MKVNSLKTNSTVKVNIHMLTGDSMMDNGFVVDTYTSDDNIRVLAQYTREGAKKISGAYGDEGEEYVNTELL